MSTGVSAPGFRSLTFFEEQVIKDVHDLESTPDIFKATPEISTIATCSSGVLVADIHGSIHLLNKDFESINSWVAHVGGRVTHMAERRRVLVTLGEEDAVSSPLLKIWDLESSDKRTGAPRLLRSAKVQLGNRPHPISTLALSANLSYLAIGLGDGTVLLYRHLDQSLASSSSLTSLPKPRTVHESPTEPITGLGFREVTEDSPHVFLFILTVNHVLSYQTSGRGAASATVIDEIGAGLGCATMDHHAKDLIVARDEAIYACSPEGRGTCWAVEGHKSAIHTHQNYLIIVSPPIIPTGSHPSATVRHFSNVAHNAGDMDASKVTVFDPDNKITAYSAMFSQGARQVISAWGNIYVLTNDGVLKALIEKPTSVKLDMLYSRSLLPLALNLAKTQGLDEASVADIHQHYGNQLYAKGDYDAAMQQFVQTIGHLQPSYVIRKFLDAQRIHNLVTYLQELHSLGLANADHTTLLLNTYTKLKDVSRLDSFIKTESRRNSLNSDELPFDLDTAIRVCRQAGYFEHASYLAKKYERHEDYLRIQIEDAENYKDALSYLRKLGPDATESNLARYGRAMLANLPVETTQLLIDLCTMSASGTLAPEPEDVPPAVARANTAGPSYLSYLALNRNSIVAEIPIPPSPSIKTRFVTRRLPTAHPPPALPPPPKPVKRLSPRLYFAHFVDHMDQFVLFLETVARRRWGQTVNVDPGSPFEPPLEPPADVQADREDQVAVWNTLLELYLTLGDDDAEARKNREKGMRVLQSSTIPYDPTHALILCATRGYTEGLVLLWEHMGMYEDVLRFWMDKDKEGDREASAEVVRQLKAYGRAHPHLYPLVLRFLTSSGELLGRHQQDVRDVLEHINRESIMPPLGVIQVLSRNGVASVGLVKEWMMTRIKEARDEIQADQEWTASYRMETAAKLRQVEDLSDPEHPRVFHVTRCTSCGGQLDLPSVHFMCNHSYHQRCLPDNETECPNCAREYGMIREIRRNNERLADQHDVFLEEVRDDGFKAVAEGFGRGALNWARVEEVSG
ncbi:hypothetical protein BDZ89DRAFT_1101711 [Hymenopellis radicata]|nr:hypothetical protein BDZ89DRAFT_1101711 [Hymenopellis radicata]